MVAGSHPAAGGRIGGLRLLFTTIFTLSIYFASIPAVSADTCFRLDGQPMVNNRKCPGSNACCGETATCLSNRLCHNEGDPPDLFVRGPCLIKGWNGSNDCAQICLFNETATNRMPRVTQCSDGSLCCDDNKNCCAEKKGIFLDPNGMRVSARATGATLSFPPGVSTTSSSSSSSTTTLTTTLSLSTLTTETTSSSTTTRTTLDGSQFSSSSTSVPITGTSSDSDTVGLKVGLGLGIPLAVLISGLLVYCFFKKRNAAARAETAGDYQSTAGPVSEMHGDPSYFPEAPPNYKPRYVYSNGGLHTKSLSTTSKPVEIGTVMPSEMDGRTAGSQPPQRYYEMG
ncbi:hypothetical protein QBC38DRAFT_533578 [Podospora fimiseda]|uniref:Mid2 domain-containing protein n=1 Tax=Podospora fimiseda TaxID=252190 RepID=A0AAN7H833_9PEZI|nr:hypothetical protein QBC38DRAFT_533578 [Podospora fimiseda]